jgi:hypothetical protein
LLFTRSAQSAEHILIRRLQSVWRSAAISLGKTFPATRLPNFQEHLRVRQSFGFFYSPHWNATEDIETKRAVFCTAPAIRSLANNFFCEMAGTAVLLFGLNFLGTDYANGLKPLAVGALVTIIGFSLGGTTGYAINPARDLGPRLAHFLLPISGKGHSDWVTLGFPLSHRYWFVCSALQCIKCCIKMIFCRNTWQ